MIRNLLNDLITKAIMKIIDDEDLNVNLKWIKFEEFESGEKYIITGRKPDLVEDEINKLIEFKWFWWRWR